MFKVKDIVIGGVTLVVLIASALIIKKVITNKQKNNLPLPTPNIQERVQKTFGGFNIPSDRENLDLEGISGFEGIGVASRKYENGTYTLTVMADLPEPKTGYFYQAWLVKGNIGDSDFEYLPVGVLRFAKGGYIVDFTAKSDLLSFRKILVTQERVNDKTPEEHILEGSY